MTLYSTLFNTLKIVLFLLFFNLCLLATIGVQLYFDTYCKRLICTGLKWHQCVLCALTWISLVLLQTAPLCPGGWTAEVRRGPTGEDSTRGCSSAPAVWKRTVPTWTTSATVMQTKCHGNNANAPCEVY